MLNNKSLYHHGGIGAVVAGVFHGANSDAKADDGMHLDVVLHPSHPPPQLVMVRLPGQRVLLGLKKRGIGEGFYNGFGGKCEAGETVRQCAHREVCGQGYTTCAH